MIVPDTSTTSTSAGRASSPAPTDALAAGLVRAARQYRALLGQDVAAMGCLTVIDRQGPQRVSTLAAELLLDISTTSRHVAQLERAGWLARQADPADQRAVLLRLTPAGRAKLARWRQQQERLLSKATESWSVTDLETFTTLLNRLADDLANLTDPGAAA